MSVINVLHVCLLGGERLLADINDVSFRDCTKLLLKQPLTRPVLVPWTVLCMEDVMDPVDITLRFYVETMTEMNRICDYLSVPV